MTHAPSTTDAEVDSRPNPDPAATPGAADRRPALEHPLLPAAAAALTLGTLAALVATALRQPEAELPRGETLLVRTRPRRSFWRYVTTAGLFELARRTTLYRVTDRRVIVDRGVVHRSTESIPLSGIRGMSLVCGPLEGVVHLALDGGAEAARLDVGPLRSATARTFAAAIERAT